MSQIASLTKFTARVSITLDIGGHCVAGATFLLLRKYDLAISVNFPLRALTKLFLYYPKILM